MAMRNILRNRRRSFLTIMMMVAGFVFISGSLALVEGSYGDMIKLFTRQYTGHVQITHKDFVDNPSMQKTIHKYQPILDELSLNNDIQSSTARIYGDSLVYFENKSFGAEIVGFDPIAESRATYYEGRILSGEALDNNRENNILVGKTLGKILALKVGDEVALISQGADGSVANDLFTVKGIIGTEHESKDDYRIYMSLNSASDFFTLFNQVHEISIHLNDFTKARTFASHFALKDPKLIARPWQEVESDFYKTMQSDKEGNSITIAILMLMVGVGILNTVLMSILERTREFGVLKALGTLSKHLFKLIVLESLLLALTSLCFGVFIAFLLTYYLSHIGITLNEPVSFAGMVVSKLRGEITFEVFAYPALILVLTALLASLYPAWKATKIGVAQALREY